MLKIKSGFFFLVCFSFYFSQAQISGTVTDADNTPLSFVNIYLENTVTGTTTNDNGQFLLELSKTGTYTIVFKYLGFKTRKETVTIEKFPFTLDLSLTEERLSLAGVEVNASDNPANRIIRNAIGKRREYQKKLQSYTADFYSKGLIKIKNAPERILGQDVGDFGGGLDSTRSGIIYLSETISKIAKNKKAFNENIIASKISGDDNGFSFNTASDVDISYYNNTIAFGNRLVSPIADNAFGYYRYKLIGTFYDDHNNLINQISVIPKRPNDNVFRGTIYIVEDQWALYAIDLSVTGEQAQVFAVDSLFLKQDFNFSQKNEAWLKVLQRIDFQYGLFGIQGNGRFTAAYTNYNLNAPLQKKDFKNEVLSFAEAANEKDSLYWTSLRPVPLTGEEILDYVKKDSVQLIRKSKTYLDSVDRVRNRLKLGDILLGYQHRNTFKERYFNFESPLEELRYNTVQGWNSKFIFNYAKLKREEGRRLNVNTTFEYGLSDKVFRPLGEVSYRFNNFSRPFIRIRGGNELPQFNGSNPISYFGNSFRTLFLESNDAKFYDKTYVNLFYSEEVVNGIYIGADIGYEQRKPVFNTTNFSIIGDKDGEFSSNNPLAPEDFENAAIGQHNLVRLQVNARIRFGQKYLNYPNRKFNLFSNTPTLRLGYEKGFAGSSSDLHFDQFKIRLTQEFPVGGKGDFSYNLKAGAFLNADNISFVDYQHFNGNLTRISLNKDYLNSFFILPYYDLSTNKTYFEAHAEHNFKGFIMGKIPLLNKLNANLIVGGKILATENNQPYSEFSIGLGNLGWKKFRFLRIDFAQSNFQGRKQQWVNFGVQF
ncbi:DUF5686 and carboxypeptidase regulatory-like domain-containing protein [Spongiimicrobium salis]|uniref:DUF5686 and carboxypeptidase regulatory-like domain-containing protein n=1 Tax=Spongiimicrobium salis TaxID=1667022 RepID=UPI00374CD346